MARLLVLLTVKGSMSKWIGIRTRRPCLTQGDNLNSWIFRARDTQFFFIIYQDNLIKKKKKWNEVRRWMKRLTWIWRWRELTVKRTRRHCPSCVTLRRAVFAGLAWNAQVWGSSEDGMFVVHSGLNFHLDLRLRMIGIARSHYIFFFTNNAK